MRLPFMGSSQKLTVHSREQVGLNTGDNEKSQVQPTRDSFSLFDGRTNKPKCSLTNSICLKQTPFQTSVNHLRIKSLLLAETLGITGVVFSFLYK